MISLPAGIKVERRLHNGEVAYAVLKDKHEEIGGIVVRGTPTGDTQLDPYVNESCQQKAENTRLVGLVMQQMSDALLMHQAQKPDYLRRDAKPPVDVPQGTEVFETKVFPCSKCGQLVGKLVFSWDSASPEEMEMVGKKFELEASHSDYPVWVLGAPDSDDEDIAKHLTLQIAPTKGKVYWEHPEDMNQRLMALDDHHC